MIVKLGKIGGELKKKHKKGIKLHQHDEIRIHVNTIVEVKKKIPF